jgi:hypothetical protein
MTSTVRAMSPSSSRRSVTGDLGHQIVVRDCLHNGFQQVCRFYNSKLPDQLASQNSENNGNRGNDHQLVRRCQIFLGGFIDSIV